jgi:hypothetical protein
MKKRKRPLSQAEKHDFTIQRAIRWRKEIEDEIAEAGYVLTKRSGMHEWVHGDTLIVFDADTALNERYGIIVREGDTVCRWQLVNKPSYTLFLRDVRKVLRYPRWKGKHAKS